MTGVQTCALPIYALPQRGTVIQVVRHHGAVLLGSLFSNSGTENQESDIDTSALISNILNKANSDDEYINAFKSHFNPIPGMALSFALSISDQNRTLVLDMDNSKLNCYYGEKEDATATIKSNHIVIDRIISGEVSLQDRKSTRLNSSHTDSSRMPSSA